MNTYTVTRMTCNGCVEKALQPVEDVKNVSVDLEPSGTIITMKNHIALKTFQNVLPNKYHISKRKEQNVFQSLSMSMKNRKQHHGVMAILMIINFYI